MVTLELRFNLNHLVHLLWFSEDTTATTTLNLSTVSSPPSPKSLPPIRGKRAVAQTQLGFSPSPVTQSRDRVNTPAPVSTAAPTALDASTAAPTASTTSTVAPAASDASTAAPTASSAAKPVISLELSELADDTISEDISSSPRNITNASPIPTSSQASTVVDSQPISALQEETLKQASPQPSSSQDILSEVPKATETPFSAASPKPATQAKHASQTTPQPSVSFPRDSNRTRVRRPSREAKSNPILFVTHGSGPAYSKSPGLQIPRASSITPSNTNPSNFNRSADTYNLRSSSFNNGAAKSQLQRPH